jgi:ABC-type branched-subunit amino acid transport system substrate-binding protein
MYITGPNLDFSDNPLGVSFMEKHEAKYGEDPLSAFHAHAYDAANIIFDAIEKVGVTDAEGNLHIGRKALRDAVYATKGFQGITGTLSCDEYGDCADPSITVHQIRGGEYVGIWNDETGWLEGEVAEPAQGCTEDLTGETITLYHFGDLSAVYGFITQPLLAGLTDAVAYYNDQGGICGATIASEFADDGLNMEEAQAIYDRFSAADPPPLMFLLYGSDETQLLRSQLAEDEIPAFTAGVSTLGLYGESGQEPLWAFANVPPYADQVGLFCQWVSETWDKEDPPKLAHLSWAGGFGEAAATEESTAYCESLGVEVVGAEYFAPGTPDLTAQIQSLMADGANILWTNSLASGPAQVLNDAIALGERENLMIAGPNWALDTSVIGLGGAASNGLIGILPYVWWDELDHPGIQLVTQQWLANEREIATRNIAYLLAWGTLDTYIELVKTAVADVGYENLDGVAMKAAMEKLDYSSLGGVFEWTFSEEIRAPNKARIGQISFTADGTPQILPLTDWSETPDLRPGGADVP